LFEALLGVSTGQRFCALAFQPPTKVGPLQMQEMAIDFQSLALKNFQKKFTLRSRANADR
jgi:hypothetical protein